MTGLFITFEGIDGCGKSTQAALLAARLRADGVPFVHTWEPGGSEVGKILREVFLHRAELEFAVQTEVLLMGAGRAEHVARLIRPALERGETVICERYIDSTTAYQGYGSDGGEELLRQIRAVNTFATGGLEPDITFLLDLDPQEAAKRRRGRVDRIESKDLEYHRRVREGYRRIAREHPGRVVLIDASAPADVVHAQILERLFALGRPRRRSGGGEA